MSLICFRLKEIMEASILIFCQKAKWGQKDELLYRGCERAFGKLWNAYKGKSLLIVRQRQYLLYMMCVLSSPDVHTCLGVPFIYNFTRIVLPKPGDISESHRKFQTGFSLPQTSEWESLRQGPRCLHFYRILASSSKADWSWEPLGLLTERADYMRNKKYVNYCELIF